MIGRPPKHGEGQKTQPINPLKPTFSLEKGIPTEADKDITPPLLDGKIRHEIGHALKIGECARSVAREPSAFEPDRLQKIYMP